MKRFAIVALIAIAAACAKNDEKSLTIYSGRNKSLVEPILQQFEAATGIEIKVKYGDSAELAAMILEEGEHSPADVFYSQDAGSLGALAENGTLKALPERILTKVEPRFRSPEGVWVGASGRARVVVYNTDRLTEADLPKSILEFTDPKWKGKIGWAPSNGSFQAFVTAMRVNLGEEKTAEWLRGIKANEPKVYPKNSPIVAAVGAGEVEVGFVNHYYLHRAIAEHGPSFAARNYYPRSGDVGALINVSGAGVLKSSKNTEAAEAFLEHLLAPESQGLFANQNYEYPLLIGYEDESGRMTPLDEIDTPQIDLSRLADLRGTLKLLQETGVLN